MSLVSSLFSRIKALRRSSMLRLSLLLSIVFAVGMAIAIFVALTLGEDAIERRVDTTLTALAAATDVSDQPEDSPSMIVRPAQSLSGLPRAFARAVERGGGTIDLDRDLMRSDIWRVLVTNDSTGKRIMVAVPLEESAQTQELLSDILRTTAGLVIALALGIGLIAGLFAQRRVQAINTTLGQLAAGDLSARIDDTRNKDDIDEFIFRGSPLELW